MPYATIEAKREYQRNWIARRRAQWFAENGPCACGSWDRLELDHKDPEQKVTHRIWSWSKERMLAELAKCVPLCYECHKKKSRLEKAKGEGHGKSKLTETDVVHIILSTESTTELLVRYPHVGRTAINKIRRRDNWKHLDEETIRKIAEENNFPTRALT